MKKGACKTAQVSCLSYFGEPMHMDIIFGPEIYTMDWFLLTDILG